MSPTPNFTYSGRVGRFDGLKILSRYEPDGYELLVLSTHYGRTRVLTRHRRLNKTGANTWWNKFFDNEWPFVGHIEKAQTRHFYPPS